MASISRPRRRPADLPGGPSFAATVAYLSCTDAYVPRPARVRVIETTTSVVFLAGPRVYKLKRPLVSCDFDFSTPEKREANCRAEAALNARLADRVYLGVVPITREHDGMLAIGGAGEAIDWLVVMRRLPAGRMLDRVIRAGRLTQAETQAVGDRLARFYACAERPPVAADLYASRYARQIAQTRALLAYPTIGRRRTAMAAALDRLEARVRADRPLLEARARAGALVDGHGDLRPEHVCLTDPIAIFDCLEFSAELRTVDPFDEIAYLALECRRLGAPDIGPAVAAVVAERLGESPPPRLVDLYVAARALLRARQCLAHLLPERKRRPRAWRPLADSYLSIVAHALREA